MPLVPEMFASSIVAVGAFNPAIFGPDWLVRNGLLGNGDAEIARASESFITSAQFLAVQTEWFALHVVSNQFSITSQGPLSPAIKDLAVGILTLVPQTPITAIGLNFMGHYKMTSHHAYNKVGDTLAPKKIWREVFPDEQDNAGMSDMTIVIQKVKIEESGERTVLSPSYKRITLQPSTKVKLGLFGLYNDHREIVLVDLKDKTAAEQARDLINDDWKTSWDASLQVFDGLISRALAEESL